MKPTTTRVIRGKFAPQPGAIPFRFRQPIHELGPLRAPSSLDEITQEVPLKPTIPEAKVRRELTEIEQQCEMLLVGLVLSKVERMNEILPHLGEDACGRLEAQLRAAGESAKSVGKGMSPVQELMAKAPYPLFGLLLGHCRKLENSIA
jgi:hypothetical protein